MLAALLPLLAAAGAAPSYPADEVLAAFATACATAEDFAVAKAGIAAAGWTPVAEDASNPLGKLVMLGKTAVSAMADVTPLEGGSYGKMVAGRQLYLALSGATTSGITVKGCRVYDFAAPAAIPPQDLESWAVRAPNDVKEPGQGVMMVTWNPGLKPGHSEMQVGFVPADSPIGKALGVTGLNFATSAMDLAGLTTETVITETDKK
jgi:hypothetical protein